MKLNVADIPEAYLYGRPNQKRFIRSPPELGMGDRVGPGWTAACTDAKIAVPSGKMSKLKLVWAFALLLVLRCSIAFYHPVWHLRCVVHGEDCTSRGCHTSLSKYEDALKKHFDLITGRLGRDSSDDKDMKVLNKLVRVEEKGLVYEQDPWRVELLVRDLDL